MDDFGEPPPNFYHPAVSFMFTLITSYMLKNALLYELEMEEPQPSPEMMDIQLIKEWTVRIFRRLLVVFRADTFPAYFLPRQQLIVPSESDVKTLGEITCVFCKMIISLLEG